MLMRGAISLVLLPLVLIGAALIAIAFVIRFAFSLVLESDG